MMIRMLSPSTLSNVPAGVAQSGMGQARPVQSIRALATIQSQSASPTTPLAVAPSARDGGGTSNRILPRGSLLDLSV
jgi:hypothetical protein